MIQVIEAFAEDQMSSVVTPVLNFEEDNIMVVVVKVILLAKD